MSTQNDSPRSFPVNAAMSAYRVVNVSANGSLDLAAVDQRGIGILQQDCTAESYERPAVRLWGSGTFKVAVTNTPVTAGNTVVVVTSGYVAVTNGLVGNSGVIVGRSLETLASGNNGAVIEVAFAAGA